VFGSEDGEFVAVKNAVAVFLRTVAAVDEFGVLVPELLQLLGEFGFVHWLAGEGRVDRTLGSKNMRGRDGKLCGPRNGETGLM
jgi:hypothetical protein